MSTPRLMLAALALIAPFAAAAGAPMVLGTQTHFSQGWGPSLVDRVKELRAPALRDSIPWASGETRAGIYSLDGPRVRPLRDACRRSTDLLLTLQFSNPLYDGGHDATSPAAQRAYANYVKAVLDALPGCVVAIEVGNEINGGSGLDFLPGADRAASYVSLMRVLQEVVKPRHPGVKLLGGSTNLIGTGFLADYFRAGLLKVADGIVVHPYRTHAEGVDFEIDHLRATMRRYGRERPIWATEFSDNYPTADPAAPELLKMVTLMSAAGVERAYWYALIDQAWFKNMGLIGSDGRVKPAGDAFRAVQERLLPSGRARRIDTGDRRTYLFQFGTGDYVVWGATRAIRFDGAATYRNARGQPIAAPAAIGLEPLIVSGASGYRLGASPILADSLLEYGGAPWSYLARFGSGVAKPMPLRDSTYESLFAFPGRIPLRIGTFGASPGGGAANPERAVLRYTAPTAQRVKLAACFTKEAAGDGADIAVRQAGRLLYSRVMTGRLLVTDVLATLPAGGTLDIEIGPNRTAGQDSLRYRVQLVAPDAPIVPVCP